MQGRDFIIISINPWYAPLSSTSKNVAMELSKNNRVLYVNAPLDRNTLVRKKTDPALRKHMSLLKAGEENLFEIAPNLWNVYPKDILESINWIPDTRVFCWFNKINNKRFAHSILAAAKRLGFKDFILINDKDLFRGFYLKELLKPAVYLYYDRDYILGVDYWKKHGRLLEPKLAAKSDLVVSHSDHFIELLKPYNANIYNVGSGINIELFDAFRDYDIPSQLSSLKKPVIGYVGALTVLRLSIDILVRIARERPDWSIALVGPEDEAFKSSELHHLPNVFFLGKKKLEEVPAYIKYFDVCLNPQVINDITIGNYPLKIDEYLSMGRPVVATRTRGVRLFEEYAYLADREEEYVPLIERALATDNTELQQLRISFAREHSWENILRNIYAAIEKTVALKNGLYKQDKAASLP